MRLVRLFLIPFFCLATHAALCADADPEEFEPVPEGFEERHYPLANLITNRSDLDPRSLCGFSPSATNTISSDAIMAIIRYAAAPDSWTRRGAARMSVEGNTLIVLQKKEAHDEIAKVINWLREGIATPCRTTVVMAALKPDALAKLQSGNGAIAPADLFKLLEEAGDNASQIAELRGIEGQSISSTGNFRQHYIADIDVSGAVFDPVVRSLVSGFLAKAKTLRMPDGLSARVDLHATWNGPATLESTEMRLHSNSVQQVHTTYRPRTADEKKNDAGKKDDPISERTAGIATPVDFSSTLKIETPRQLSAALNATVIVPRGHFVLAGIFDLSSGGDGKVKERRAVFVRADVGNSGPPTLQGVTGLKEGELFKLYPLDSMIDAIPDFPAPMWGEPESASLVELGASGYTGNGMANPFTSAPTTAPALSAVNTPKFQALFSERVRKNKIIESYGNTMFARLNADDHAKLSVNLMGPARQSFAGVRVRAVSLAIPQAAFRKLLLDDTQKLDDAAIDALAAQQGTTSLADTALVIQPGQLTHVFGGQLASAVTDLEISGDSYDPVVRNIMEKGYAFEISYVAQNAAGLAEITARLRAYPGPSKLDKVPFESFAINSGASSEVLLTVATDLTRVRMPVVTLNGTMNLTKGQFALAASAPMPADAEGKPDARQAILLLRADDSVLP